MATITTFVFSYWTVIDLFNCGVKNNMVMTQNPLVSRKIYIFDERAAANIPRRDIICVYCFIGINS
jgi:hypothetical protein